MFMSMPTAVWSRDQRNGQDHQPEGLVPGAAGGELLDAGYLWKQPVLLERRRLVQGIARSVDRSRRTVFRIIVAQSVFLRRDPRDRGSARNRGGAVDAARRLDGRGLSRDPGAAALDSMERGRNHLADLWAARHRPVGLCAEQRRD